MFESHTVFDNLLLACSGGRGVFQALFHRLGNAEKLRIEQTLETIMLTDKRDETAANLSHGQKQWLEIGMLLMQEPELLLVDEPVAGMTDSKPNRPRNCCDPLQRIGRLWWSNMTWNLSATLIAR